MLRPITPFVEYAVNYDFISKILCINKDKPKLSCNGKCQLMKKLKEQQQEENSSLRISLEEYPIGFVNLLKVNKTNYIFKKENTLFLYKQNYHYLYNKEVFHPPAV